MLEQNKHIPVQAQGEHIAQLPELQLPVPNEPLEPGQPYDINTDRDLLQDEQARARLNGIISTVPGVDVGAKVVDVIGVGGDNLAVVDFRGNPGSEHKGVVYRQPREPSPSGKTVLLEGDFRLMSMNDPRKYASINPGGRVIVGRDPHSTLVLDDLRASRRHLSVSYDIDPDNPEAGYRLLAEDLGSSNGTTHVPDAEQGQQGASTRIRARLGSLLRK